MTHTSYDFDVIVVGGGHAGIEAAHAAATMGSRTLLVSLNLDTIGLMPCNPAIGGIGKGHIVYEVSALGGLMPRLATSTYLQARMLNTKKGPAVQGLRLQIDKYAYAALSKQMLAQVPNLTLRMGMVQTIMRDARGNMAGITTRDGAEFTAPTVILTTGTFLHGLIHIGSHRYPSGRQGEEASNDLPECLAQLGIGLGRLKTGTPPRLLRSSVNFSSMEEQHADDLDYLFEFYPHRVTNSQTCYITHTNEKTHEIIKKNIHLSAMYSGAIRGIGPRYCPSIEDKIGRFSDKNSHHVFVEPESASAEEVYPNGLSTSLPYEVQKAYIRTIAGFENAIISRPGYAIEYDFVPPHQLHPWLEVKAVPGLFLAGQINGTTGYEEAAGQGIIAGINAHLKHAGKEPFVLDRTESYIGIMIDDLVSLGVDEPYRMFTSRAERRLVLRQDNTFLRLTDKARNLGLVHESLYRDFCDERAFIADAVAKMKAAYKPHERFTMFQDDQALRAAMHLTLNTQVPSRTATTIQAELMYEPYLKREEQEIAKFKNYQSLVIPASVEIRGMPGLSRELQDKILRHKPSTIAQAALIPGMTPAALSLLIFKSREKEKVRE